MPTTIGRAFTTANLLANLTALKAINFGPADPAGVWFVVPNPTTNNVEIWIWQPDSVLATDEISVVRPDSVVPGSPGRCLQRLKFDASQLGGILSAINALNTAGIIERTAQGGAATITLSSYMRGLLDDTSDSAARTTLGLGFINNTSDIDKPVSSQQQFALNLKADVSALGFKANLASPTFTGIPAVPTATAGTNTTQAASTAFVTSGLALKADLISPVFTGNLVIPSSAGTIIGTLWRNIDNLEYKDNNNVTRILLNSAGNLGNLSDRQIALNNLVGTQTANRLLRSNGTNIILAQADLATDITGTLPVANGTNFVSKTLNENIAGIISFTNTTQATTPTNGGTRCSGGLSVVGNIVTSGSIIQTINHSFRAAASTSQTIPNATFTKINLTSEVNDSNGQYDPVLSRLTATTTELWRISLFITFNLGAASRILLSIYKNGAETNGVRVMDNPTNAGFFGQSITIPEISLVAGDYLEVFCFTSPGQSVYGDATLGATYWYGKRIN
ncbi:MAG: hypothetical protein M3N42_16160 [Cyanobacteriota bacterium]|nr:hypothetical protein [Cyanobacteriota bacterium]